MPADPAGLIGAGDDETLTPNVEDCALMLILSAYKLRCLLDIGTTAAKQFVRIVGRYKLKLDGTD
jgi:hypothetical protein